jgi:hypothetical protein
MRDFYALLFIRRVYLYLFNCGLCFIYFKINLANFLLVVQGWQFLFLCSVLTVHLLHLKAFQQLARQASSWFQSLSPKTRVLALIGVLPSKLKERGGRGRHQL